MQSVIAETENAFAVVRYVKSGHTIASHVYPNEQDSWIILSGRGKYYLDYVITREMIASGGLVIASTGCVHGLVNIGDQIYFCRVPG